jgi:hypothetical protein
MMDFVKEIREQRAQGATETEILLAFISAYDKEEIDFDELMKRVDALNGEFNTQYDVSPLDGGEGEGEEEQQQADDEQLNNLFGIENEEENVEE